MSATPQAHDEDEDEEKKPTNGAVAPLPPAAPQTPTRPTAQTEDHEVSGGDEEEEEEEEEEEDGAEAKLKYAKLTSHLANIYRGRDSTSTFLVAGDKYIVGTHNGNVHVLSLPGLQNLRTYHAHSATITGISISPVPPAPTTIKTSEKEGGGSAILSPAGLLSRTQSVASVPKQQPASPRTPRAPVAQPQANAVPPTPNNAVYISTSSLDGHVCTSSLLDPSDVLLRNFARPLNAVALSPDYKNDRTYLSGGRAGQLVLTVGGKPGVSQDANITGVAAAASGWLGSIGLGGGAVSGKDTILHQGEGSVGSIKWSSTGKWVVWVNEEGIKIMRSHLGLGTENVEDAWRRIAHAGKPNRTGWSDGAGVWKARCEWVDSKLLESDDDEMVAGRAGTIQAPVTPAASNGTPSKKATKKIEKLVVGWGDTAWVLHVHTGGTSHSGQRQIGSADIVHKLQFRDCIVSGLALYTPSLLAILAYRTRDDDDNPIQSVDSPGSATKGRQRSRRTGLAPQLRLVNVVNGEEVDVDELSISRFETLSAQDYHLGTLYMPPPLPEKATKEQQRGALEAVWEASGGGYATRLFSSGASVLSGSSSDFDKTGASTARASVASPKGGSIQGVTPTAQPRRQIVDAHPYASSSGLKLWVMSPYDCVLAVKRGLEDRLEWLMEREEYGPAWELLDKHPEVAPAAATARSRFGRDSEPSTPSLAKGSLADFFGDTSSQSTGNGEGTQQQHSAARKEKIRIADLWLNQLTSRNMWEEAGKVTGKVLGRSERWEHWVWTFAQANRFDEITPYIPAAPKAIAEEDAVLTGGDGVEATLPSTVYELILGHYIQADAVRLTELLDVWEADSFDVRSVISAIEARLDSGDVSEKTVEGGEKGRDWRILMSALGKLYLAAGRSGDAFRCFVRVQDADQALALVREGQMSEAVAEDVPGLLMLKVSKEQLRSAENSELEVATSEAISILVAEALRGTIMPDTVIQQLERRGRSFQLYLFFYLRALWRGPETPADDNDYTGPRKKFDRRLDEGRALVEDHADLAVSLFATYDRDLLLTFLKASEVYSYEKAGAICEQAHYTQELVYILSKTGQTKRALSLIIGELGDVSQAIHFAKENGELWDDLLEYSMDKPTFIRGLLEEVGTAINPIQLVRRIPEGLEIEGLKAGIQRMIREFEIQVSISEGVARVLRGEVGIGMQTLRAGRGKGVRFEVLRDGPGAVDLAVHDPPTRVDGGEVLPVAKRKVETKTVKPGHCIGCGDCFREDGKCRLVPSILSVEPRLTKRRTRATHRLRVRACLSPLMPSALESRYE